MKNLNYKIKESYKETSNFPAHEQSKHEEVMGGREINIGDGKGAWVKNIVHCMTEIQQ